jgi:hypothetical protein
MEATSKEHLQSKAGAMVACLEFIKLNIKSESNYGRIANGKNKLSKWLCRLHKLTPIYVNVAFWIFIFYIIFF